MPLVGTSLAIFVVSAVMMTLSTVTVLLRTFVRLYVLRAFGWDDVLILAALALFVILSVCCFIGTMNGVGRSRADFTNMEVYRKALLYWWLSQIFYVWASALTKVSIAISLLRLTVSKIHCVVLWSNIGLTVAIGLMFWLVLLLGCDPISYFWDFADPMKSGTCMSEKMLVKIAYVYSCLTIVCDLTLGILPYFLVWKLQMNNRTKFAVGGILSMGAIASVAVIIRLPFLHFYADANFLRSTYQIAIWSVVETGLGITASSLITLRPLFRWLLDESLSHVRHERSSGRGSGQYPLSSLRSHGLKNSHDPNFWLPDCRSEHDSNVTNTVLSSLPQDSIDYSSSQEALNRQMCPATSKSHITIQRTLVQTVSERQK
ncbi:pectinesterase precursor [Aspergillus pseudotamarii]|uniref:Pectinesterase n=1 Tax=Aspergillus pseudotamarii TaxID=132259 RepID=A0A5N6T6B9_ASPPS|nr:pectinesterase precursor [Aspergillus pseudotamarii]KAE8141806.1 pectinesterase precursor [Aspergillus pseudotamarii]